MRRNPVPDLSLVPDVDWARLAAYIDGEGCIRIAGVKGSTPFSRRVFYLEVTIVNTDFRLTQWLKETFGGSVFINNKGDERRSPTAAWVVGSKHAATLVAKCLPFFVIKREQADVALAFQNTIIVDRRYGRTGRPIELIQQQQAMKEKLQDLKGTSGRRLTRVEQRPTIQ